MCSSLSASGLRHFLLVYSCGRQPRECCSCIYIRVHSSCIHVLQVVLWYIEHLYSHTSNNESFRSKIAIRSVSIKRLAVTAARGTRTVPFTKAPKHAFHHHNRHLSSSSHYHTQHMTVNKTNDGDNTFHHSPCLHTRINLATTKTLPLSHQTLSPRPSSVIKIVEN